MNRLKLLAFAFGAGVAGLTGSIFAASHSAVFPANFDMPLLITIYAMVILGGAGSLAGVVLGAIVINVSLELLRETRRTTRAGLLLRRRRCRCSCCDVRPWWRLGGGARRDDRASGSSSHALVAAVCAAWTGGERRRGRRGSAGVVDGLGRSCPADPIAIGNCAFVGSSSRVLGADAAARAGWRTVAARSRRSIWPPFVWENVLRREPASRAASCSARSSIALMTARPQGLLGTPRVEIV